ncbi:hypothetical protein [Streptococcus marmotae]|uniref:hypothetical protein n=1 Tax=Streptococcus marmotae TaxID=1825069 RepID=UPI000A78778C
MLHHIEINVANLATSRVFYEQLFADLGYELDQEWEKGFSYRYRNTYLVFVQNEEDYREPSYHRKQTGLNHACQPRYRLMPYTSACERTVYPYSMMTATHKLEDQTTTPSFSKTQIG